MELLYDLAVSLLGTYVQNNWKLDLTKIFAHYVHSSIIHNARRSKQPKSPSADEHTQVCPLSGILTSLEKEGNSVTYNVDKAWGRYVQCNKPNHKRQILSDSIQVPKVMKPIESESRTVGAGQGEGQWGVRV